MTKTVIILEDNDVEDGIKDNKFDEDNNVYGMKHMTMIRRQRRYTNHVFKQGHC